MIRSIAKSLALIGLLCQTALATGNDTAPDATGVAPSESHNEYNLHYLAFKNRSSQDWGTPYEGALKKPLDELAFYEKLGRKDLVAALERRKNQKRVLGIVGGAILVGGVISAVLNHAAAPGECHGNYSTPGYEACIERQMGDHHEDIAVISLAVALIGGGLLTWGIALSPHPIDAGEARQLAEEHNQKLKETLDTSEAETLPESKASKIQIAVRPFANRSGGGLALGFTF